MELWSFSTQNKKEERFSKPRGKSHSKKTPKILKYVADVFVYFSKKKSMVSNVQIIKNAIFSPKFFLFFFQFFAIFLKTFTAKNIKYNLFIY